MKKALVTGICGFVGQYLAHALLERGYQVYGVYHQESDLNAYPEEIFNDITFFQCDIAHKGSVTSIISYLDLDVIFHLAGITFIPMAEADLETAFQVNVFGTENILNAIKHKKGCKFVYISSSEVYAPQPPDKMPYTEEHPIAPSNIYGITKHSSEMMCAVHARKWATPYLVFRPFNHIGPRQNKLFVASDFACQIAMIEKGLKKPELSVGNIDTMRDFSDVRDVVQGYVIASEKIDRNETYNICSGNACRIEDLLKQLIELSHVPIKLSVNPSKFRKTENPVIQGSYAKLNRDAGWEPKIPLRQSLKDILDYWRSTV
ncbi:MAG: SDR family NAD(P)-dependent oxidoreductase [bacterium]|nr:SDR family NAD(P)-dependent oxidoreductase [bacterium]